MTPFVIANMLVKSPLSRVAERQDDRKGHPYYMTGPFVIFRYYLIIAYFGLTRDIFFLRR